VLVDIMRENDSCDDIANLVSKMMELGHGMGDVQSGLIKGRRCHGS